MKTLQEYIELYEKHTGEKFVRNENFSFSFCPAHGFCELRIENGSLYIWQLCGDLKHWMHIALKICHACNLNEMVAYIVRKPLPFIRRLGFKVYEHEVKEGYNRYRSINKEGEKLIATQYGDRYTFIREVKQNAKI